MAIVAYNPYFTKRYDVMRPNRKVVKNFQSPQFVRWPAPNMNAEKTMKMTTKLFILNPPNRYLHSGSSFFFVIV